MNKIVKACLVTFLLASGCQDDEGIKFEGIIARGLNNEPLGTIGSNDLNDWQNEGELSAEVMKLLDFDLDLDLTGTSVSSVQMAAYPNPVSNSFRLDFGSIQNSVIRIVIVNESMKVLFRESFVGIYSIEFDMRDPKKFPNNEIVRIYYSFSALDNPNYYIGHGDVLICRTSKCRGFNI